MFQRALGRAFRLRIEPNEISPAEVHALTSASPPIVEPHLQAFLAWRRSVLFLVALALIPLTILRFVDAYADGTPSQLRFLVLLPAVAEGLLCAVCWYQLKHWTRWRHQRRVLFRTWLVFMAAPFLVFLVPLESLIEEIVRAQLAGQMGFEAAAMGANATSLTAMYKVSIAVLALVTLAPKAVSLLAGTVRAGIVTKMLFPGSAGPGWIVVLATPLYALFVFTLLIVPYQLTGSGWFFGAMLALGAAQVAIGRAGYALARPTTHDEAVQRVGRARGSYLAAMLAFAVCMVVALGSVAEQLSVTSIITVVLSFQTNVMLLTLIGSDLVVTNLARAGGLTSETTHLVDESNRQLSAFVGET